MCVLCVSMMPSPREQYYKDALQLNLMMATSLKAYIPEMYADGNFKKLRISDADEYKPALPWSQRPVLTFVLDRKASEYKAVSYLASRLRAMECADSPHLWWRVVCRASAQAALTPTIVMLTSAMNCWRGCVCVWLSSLLCFLGSSVVMVYFTSITLTQNLSAPFCNDQNLSRSCSELSTLKFQIQPKSILLMGAVRFLVAESEPFTRVVVCSCVGKQAVCLAPHCRHRICFLASLRGGRVASMRRRPHSQPAATGPVPPWFLRAQSRRVVQF